MAGAFPDPRRLPVSNPRDPQTGILPGFDRSFLTDPVQPQAGQQGFQVTTIDDLLALESDPTQRDLILRGFNFWALSNGLPADTSDPELTAAYLRTLTEEPAGPAAVGRTQFESERELDIARAGLLQQQAQTESFVRENQRQQAQSTAMERVTSMFDLLQTTDQLADARRQNAVQALIQAAPFMVDPSQQFAPGFEPGGVGGILGGLLGANVPNQMLPTAELPLSELANPQLAAPPSAIADQLNPMLTAPGQSQIPF